MGLEFLIGWLQMSDDRFQLYLIYRLAPNLPLRFDNYWSFNSAHDVATFMWGRSIGEHLIYKYGHLVFVAHLYHAISELEECLDAFSIK